MNNKNKIKKTVPFRTASKEKILGNNLTEVQDLYIEKCKTLLERN